MRLEADQKVAVAQAAAASAQEAAQKEAAAQVQVYVSKWKEEYEKRRKLHDMVGGVAQLWLGRLLEHEQSEASCRVCCDAGRHCVALATCFVNSTFTRSVGGSVG